MLKSDTFPSIFVLNLRCFCL